MTTPAKSLLATLAVAVLSLSVSMSAQAQNAPATPKVDERQARQEGRIAQGAASGELTPRETRRLKHEQHSVRRAEAHAKADGVVTPAERRHLHAKQDRASRHIHHQKHDAQAVPPAAKP
ncbi:hypothetical protein [Ideonella sp. A 288]|uniref:hypothetical protein n=1 Tax=Ideonella sp. A 288 TaxID=1962181 RepID=UPI0018FE7EA4|nr:hypothetical protein [Ideonella sp. A 288]